MLSHTRYLPGGLTAGQGVAVGLGGAIVRSQQHDLRHQPNEGCPLTYIGRKFLHPRHDDPGCKTPKPERLELVSPSVPRMTMNGTVAGELVDLAL